MEGTKICKMLLYQTKKQRVLIEESCQVYCNEDNELWRIASDSQMSLMLVCRNNSVAAESLLIGAVLLDNSFDLDLPTCWFYHLKVWDFLKTWKSCAELASKQNNGYFDE